MARLFLFLLVFLLGCPCARASLGDSVASLEKDRASVNGSAVTSKESGAYVVHTIGTSTREIREYATPEGTIFAVAWHGVGHPDLTQLLGSYYSELLAADHKPGEKKRPRGRVTHSILTGAHVVVKRFGQFRSARGIAYLPALIPAGVTADDLQ
jgi:hypothetical protein